MDFLINSEELATLSGIPHLQQLVYFRGIRPYMDVKTGMVGIKRGISLQSIAEQLYIEPYPGIKSESFSRAQVRRALAGLMRTGIISNHSKDQQLILKCELATRDYSVQNKAVTVMSQQVVTTTNSQPIEIQQNFHEKLQKTDTGEMAKADTPLKEKNYISLLSQFEKFWSCYPEKKSRQNAQKIFQQLNPDEALFNKIMQAVTAQIKNRDEKQLQGNWIPPWKFPANWLINQCWNDELTLDQAMDKHQENQHATRRKNTGNESPKDMFWIPSEPEPEPVDEQAEQSEHTEYHKNNVIPFQRCK